MVAKGPKFVKLLRIVFIEEVCGYKFAQDVFGQHVFLCQIAQKTSRTMAEMLTKNDGDRLTMIDMVDLLQ